MDNSATIEVLSGGQLQLSSDTINNSGVITVDTGTTRAQLTLTSTTITQTASLGSITNSGTVTLAGTDTINNGALDNTSTGHIYVTGLSNEIENENASDATNILSNAGHLEVKASAELQLSGDTVNNSDFITVDAGGQLTLTGDILDNGGGIITVAAQTHAGHGGGQLTCWQHHQNGTIDNYGTLDLTGSDTIQIPARSTIPATSMSPAAATQIANELEHQLHQFRRHHRRCRRSADADGRHPRQRRWHHHRRRPDPPARWRPS